MKLNIALLLFMLALIGSRRAASQTTNVVSANVVSALTWDDTEARTDFTGYLVTITPKIGTNVVAEATVTTNRMDLLGLMGPVASGVYRAEVRKLCQGGLRSDPSEPLLFSWNAGFPAAPTRTRITTTVTIQ